MATYVRRKKNRLIGYDYSSCGAYFVTICTKDQRKLFWKENVLPDSDAIRSDAFLSEHGVIVRGAIKEIPVHYPMVSVENYAVMLNHIHLLLLITYDSRRRTVRAPTISTIVNQMKGAVTKKIGFSVRQKLFHDHIVRNANDYEKIWQYIEMNPLRWKEDCFYREESFAARIGLP